MAFESWESMDVIAAVLTKSVTSFTRLSYMAAMYVLHYVASQPFCAFIGKEPSKMAAPGDSSSKQKSPLSQTH